MYSVAFIFEPGEYDEEFFTLDNLIAEAAEAMENFVGKESWISDDGKQRNSIYYWQDEDSIKAFSRHPKHIEAKRQYERWYNGYHIVISRVERSYGDGAFEHITSNSRKR